MRFIMNKNNKIEIHRNLYDYAEPWNGLECLFGYTDEEWEQMIVDACFGC